MAPSKPHILIVDHEPASASVLARMLATEYKVQRARDAPHALNAARRIDRMPDLILLDVRPPVREGFEICRQLKADEMTRSVPVMLITQRDNAEDEVRGLELGAADCITRPLRPDVAKARISNQIRLKINNDLLERYANQDGLTDVANRRRFDLALDAEWRRAMREGNALSLLMVDVDCFKQYNDRYGHRQGDECLRRVAGAMAQALTRPGDLLARYGGEEFAVILPGTELEGARLMGERLRDAVADMSIPHAPQDGARRVTISVGCASAWPNPNLTYHQLLQTADDQLYAAKKAGRNCVHAQELAA
jgi:diguanylate cyclase (GGDEF)-like protein